MTDFIPISEEQKTFIANGIFQAISLDMPEMIEENNLPTTLASGQFRWNFINRNLSDAFEADFEAHICPRGSWKVLLLRDLASNLSFSIMAEKNFRKVQKNASQKTHYLEALISKNKNREPIERQMCMEGFQKRSNTSILYAIREQLLCSFSGIVEEHVLVLFDSSFSNVTSLRAVLLTPNMDVAVSENWTKYLTSTFIPSSSMLAAISSDDDPIVKLKPEYEASNSIVLKANEGRGNSNG